MTLIIPHSKTDQTGEQAEGIDTMRRIYSNPDEPWKCPILLTAIHFFSTERIAGNLFEGEDQHVRYGNILRDLMHSLPDSDLKTVCDNAYQIGTHSFRKGAVTYALQFPDLCNVTDVYLRAGWSLGSVQNRYVFMSPGADGCVGRVMCGLVPTDDSFTALCPHFHPNDLNEVLPVDWKTVYPQYNELPESFKTVFPYFVASLWKHSDFIKKTYHPSHPIFRSKIFLCNHLTISSKVVELRGKRIYGGYKHCEETGLTASGMNYEYMMGDI